MSPYDPSLLLPDGLLLLERGWLSSNNLLCLGRDHTAVVDTGYASHAEQTVALVQHALAGRVLDAIVNTHLHSDHCGGNAALQRLYPQARTLIPPGEAQAVAEWNTAALSYETTGQICPRFRWDALMHAGSTLRLGDAAFEVHAAPGHDPHAVLLFEPRHRLLVAGDALWRNGFGLVFPELHGESGFDEVQATLDLIERLAPRVVVPGHGPAFAEVDAALSDARRRLHGYRSDPPRHARHAIKVLIKFKLMELRQAEVAALVDWALSTRHLRDIHQRFFAGAALPALVQQLMRELHGSGALRIDGTTVVDT